MLDLIGMAGHYLLMNATFSDPLPSSLLSLLFSLQSLSLQYIPEDLRGRFKAVHGLSQTWYQLRKYALHVSVSLSVFGSVPQLPPLSPSSFLVLICPYSGGLKGIHGGNKKQQQPCLQILLFLNMPLSTPIGQVEKKKPTSSAPPLPSVLPFIQAISSLF